MRKECAGNLQCRVKRFPSLFSQPPQKFLPQLSEINEVEASERLHYWGSILLLLGCQESCTLLFEVRESAFDVGWRYLRPSLHLALKCLTAAWPLFQTTAFKCLHFRMHTFNHVRFFCIHSWVSPPCAHPFDHVRRFAS